MKISSIEIWWIFWYKAFSYVLLFANKKIIQTLSLSLSSKFSGHELAVLVCTMASAVSLALDRSLEIMWVKLSFWSLWATSLACSSPTSERGISVCPVRIWYTGIMSISFFYALSIPHFNACIQLITQNILKHEHLACHLTFC